MLKNIHHPEVKYVVHVMFFHDYVQEEDTSAVEKAVVINGEKQLVFPEEFNTSLTVTCWTQEDNHWQRAKYIFDTLAELFGGRDVVVNIEKASDRRDVLLNNRVSELRPSDIIAWAQNVLSSEDPEYAAESSEEKFVIARAVEKARETELVEGDD